MTDHQYLPVGFNAFRESDGRIPPGKIESKQIMVFEAENPIYMWDVIDPPSFYECEDSRKQSNEVVRNIRAVLQLLDIKVFVYSNRVEIKGAIPPQLLGMNDVKESLPAPVINSGRGTKGGWVIY